MHFLCIAVLCSTITAKILNIEDYGAISDHQSLDACNKNSQVMNTTLSALQPDDTLLVPNKTFWLIGGIYASGIKHATIQIDGTLIYTDDQKAWPRDSKGHVFECMYFEKLENVTFTSSGKGTINGNGKGWWGAVEYLLIGENRPRLFHIYNSKQLLVENLFFKDSPYWTFWANDISDLEIRYTDIDARRTNISYHDLFDMTAFNTDGFDVTGKNVYIHDCNIWNDDDCIAVKDQNKNGHQSDCSENMLFERINASGVGLTIGSIGSSKAHTCVRNITFRNIVMENTFKGIYMKSRPGKSPNTGEITDITYEDITINNPTQWAIWIGPQQAIYGKACSLLWPEVPGTKCPVPAEITWNNIVLRNIKINNPKMSPGVILGNETNPMKNIIFDNVVVTNPGTKPWGDKYYACTNVVGGIAKGGTNPVPPCFNKDTTEVL